MSAEDSMDTSLPPEAAVVKTEQPESSLPAPEMPSLRRSSTSNEVRLPMIHLYSNSRLKKELSDRGLSSKGNTQEMADRLYYFLSGEPFPGSAQQKKSKSRQPKPRKEPTSAKKEPIAPEAKPKRAYKRRQPSNPTPQEVFTPFFAPPSDTLNPQLDLDSSVDSNAEIDIVGNADDVKWPPGAPPPTPVGMSPNTTLVSEEGDEASLLAAAADAGGAEEMMNDDEDPKPPRLENMIRLDDVLFVLVPPSFHCEEGGCGHLHYAYEELYRMLKSLGSVASVIVDTSDFTPREDEQLWETLKFYVNVVRGEVIKQLNDPRNKAKRIVLVGWRLSCYINHSVVQMVPGISAVINLAFPLKTRLGYRGSENDEIVLTYCPTLFVVGTKSANYSLEALELLRNNMRCTTVAVQIPGGDDNLLMPEEHLQLVGLTQSDIYHSVTEDIRSFLTLPETMKPRLLLIPTVFEPAPLPFRQPTYTNPLLLLQPSHPAAVKQPTHESVMIYEARQHFVTAVKKARMPPPPLLTMITPPITKPIIIRQQRAVPPRLVQQQEKLQQVPEKKTIIQGPPHRVLLTNKRHSPPLLHDPEPPKQEQQWQPYHHDIPATEEVAFDPADISLQ